jgi:tagatose 6-phosphate kinase
MPVRLVGIVDAAHREPFSAFMADRGVEFHGFLVEGGIRTCLAIRENGGRTTEILEPGPEVEEGTRREMLDGFRALCAGAAFAVLSGSVPRGLGEDTYAELVESLARGGVPCLVDASGELLRRAVAARPYLVKPNRQEAEDLGERSIEGPIESAEDAAHWARGVAGPGGPRIVVSLGADGAVGLAGDEAWHVRPPAVPVRNPVGSGDCLLGGLAVALASGCAFPEALRLGVACGTANALSRDTGIASRADVDALLPRLTSTRLEPRAEVRERQS